MALPLSRPVFDVPDPNVLGTLSTLFCLILSFALILSGEIYEIPILPWMKSEVYTQMPWEGPNMVATIQGIGVLALFTGFRMGTRPLLEFSCVMNFLTLLVGCNTVASHLPLCVTGLLNFSFIMFMFELIEKQRPLLYCGVLCCSMLLSSLVLLVQHYEMVVAAFRFVGY
jgi:hypothetical protein